MQNDFVVDCHLIQEIKKLIIEVGNFSLEKLGKSKEIKFKLDASPVTEVDLIVNEMIVSKLKELTPNIPVISEEGINFKQPTDNLFWLIDPIDGTKSYIKGESGYTVNIALISGVIPILGFILQPVTGMLYYTDNNMKFTVEKNGKLIKNYPKTRKNKGNSSLIATTTPYALDDLTQYFLAINNINQFITVSSSIKLCLIAAGEADIYPRFGKTMEWDLAAGHALLNSVGGDIIDFNFYSLKYGKEDFVNINFLDHC